MTMMNVQTMRLVVDEVQAGAVPRVVTAAAARWNAGGPVHVRSSANHVFRVLQNGRPRYLRLTPSSERGRDAVRAELDFILHVGRAGLAVARPLPSTQGALVEELVDGRQRYEAVLLEALEGEQHEWDELDEPAFRAWGRTLARLHRASETFPASSARPDWRHEICAALETLPAGEASVAGVLASGLAWLDALPGRDRGLLHGDFELDNLFWDGDRIQVLDFDAAVYGPYAVDVAIALQDVWRAGRDERLAWFFDGYSEMRPLPEGVEAALPRLGSLVSAVKMAQLLRAYATTDDANSPEWVTAMRARHERWLGARRAELP
jgi:Ser/Thr protein kinase RdoA (MazF antagonist)